MSHSFPCYKKTRVGLYYLSATMKCSGLSLMFPKLLVSMALKILDVVADSYQDYG